MLMKIFKRFADDRQGHVAIIFGITAVPVIFALGVGMDYGGAAQKRAHVNAIADAAALMAVTPMMMASDTTTTAARSIALFDSQMLGLKGVNYTPGTVSVVPTDTMVNGTKMRQVVVTYSATSTNSFSGVLGVKTIAIAGKSTSKATIAANIDFYLMVDTSPSMAIAATTDGITTMVNATPKQGGCAFACHQTNPAADNLQNPGGKTQDNYALARQLGVTLRMDLVTQAVSSMITAAANQEKVNKAIYRIAGYSFDVSTNNTIPLTADLTSGNPNSATTLSSNFQILQVDHENYLTSSINNSDMDTDFDQAFTSLNQAMPAPGNGTNSVGDTPQEVLFIVTDGVSDQLTNGRRIFSPFGSDPSWCTKIKTRGIRIAVLYTTYNPLPTNSFYNSNISRQQPNYATTAQACASPNLYTQVNTNGDIATAMTNLFKAASKSAYLTQ